MSDIINYLTKIRFGEGAVGEIAEEASLLGLTRLLVVTDPGLLETGLVHRAIEAGGLPAETPIFSATPQNPTEDAVGEALAAFNEAGCDGLIAIGGGSSLDLAKAVALLATHDGPLEPYAAIHGGAGKIGAVRPVIAVPTTAGTGSEVGRAALITLSTGRKLGFVSPNLIPRCAICDPELTHGLPPALTAATGMDAISHCVETFLSPRMNPVADAIALDGLARAWRHLRRAVENGADRSARREMMMAALEGALAFQKGLGAVHSTSHALGGLREPVLHHGTLNAVMMAPVLRFNAPVCADKYAQMRAAMGLGPEEDLADAMTRMCETLDLPLSLSAMGVPSDRLDELAQWSFADHSTATNPRKATADDFRDILQDAMG